MKTSFVLLSQSRAGSTLLKELIDSHPEIVCEDELFNSDEGYVKNQFFLNLWKKVPYPFIYYRRFVNTSKLYSFNLFTYHLERTGRAIHILHKLGWKIIYLKRDDVVEQVLSAVIAAEAECWHRVEDEKITERKYTIPVEKFIVEVKARIMWRNVEANILQNIPHLPLTYEENLQNEPYWQKSLNNVFEYLGVEPVSVQSGQKKMYSRPYYKMIENYDELVKKLKSKNLDYLLNRKQ